MVFNELIFNNSQYLIKNQTDEFIVNEENVCEDGLFLAFWPHEGHSHRIAIHGIIYFLALIYTFIGVAIIADRFMGAIEHITSRERNVIFQKANGEFEIISVLIWNKTVANLTLMAVGTSAPDILLTVIEIWSHNFESGSLGPATIVGSAAFNMFVVVAICIWIVPNKEVKKIRKLFVYCTTLSFSIFAYIWLLYILLWSTPRVIDVWEALLTLAFFPILVLCAYVVDKRRIIFIYLRNLFRMNIVYGGAQTGEGVSLRDGYTDVIDDYMHRIEKNKKKIMNILCKIRNDCPDLSDEQLIEHAQLEWNKHQPKSRAYYQMQALRKLTGNGNKSFDTLSRGQSNINSELFKQLSAENQIIAEIFFVSKDYTVFENWGKIPISISRSGALQPTILVDYSTVDGTAKCGIDYESLSGSIRFAIGEQQKQITIKIIDRVIDEMDKYLFVKLSNARYETLVAKFRHNIRITDSEAKVTILGVNHCGVFAFETNNIEISESVVQCRLKVNRICGSKGDVVLPYVIRPGTAIEGRDYSIVDTELYFANNQTEKDIIINIINTDSYEKSKSFDVQLGKPYLMDTSHTEYGKSEPDLGEPYNCRITIRESQHFKAIVDNLLRKQRVFSAFSIPSSAQFIKIAPELKQHIRPEENTTTTHILKYLTIFWKILFSFIPPAHVCNGWLCLILSIIVIGILTTFINDLATHFGCTIGLKESVTATALVSLGTSLPDVFASRIAALNDIYADSSIGFVCGNNAVNVFVGIGLAWTVASIHHYINGTDGGFKVDPGNLAFSVTIFSMGAFICASILLLRRLPKIGGELGGPMVYKLLCTVILLLIWILYVIITSMEAYGYFSSV